MLNWRLVFLAVDFDGNVRGCTATVIFKCQTRTTKSPGQRATNKRVLDEIAQEGWRCVSGSYVLDGSAVIQGNLKCQGSISSLGADYAEHFELADPTGTLSPGQVVGIDDDGKVGLNTTAAKCIGIVSEAPAVLGNDPMEDDEGAPRAPIALVSWPGQVKVLARGPISKGATLIPSGEDDGTAIELSLHGNASQAIGFVIGDVSECQGDGVFEIKVILSGGRSNGTLANPAQSRRTPKQDATDKLFRALEQCHYPMGIEQALKEAEEAGVSPSKISSAREHLDLLRECDRSLQDAVDRRDADALEVAISRSVASRVPMEQLAAQQALLEEIQPVTKALRTAMQCAGDSSALSVALEAAEEANVLEPLRQQAACLLGLWRAMERNDDKAIHRQLGIARGLGIEAEPLADADALLERIVADAGAARLMQLEQIRGLEASLTSMQLGTSEETESFRQLIKAAEGAGVETAVVKQAKLRLQTAVISSKLAVRLRDAMQGKSSVALGVAIAEAEKSNCDVDGPLKDAKARFGQMMAVDTSLKEAKAVAERHLDRHASAPDASIATNLREALHDARGWCLVEMHESVRSAEEALQKVDILIGLTKAISSANDAAESSTKQTLISNLQDAIDAAQEHQLAAEWIAPAEAALEEVIAHAKQAAARVIAQEGETKERLIAIVDKFATAQPLPADSSDELQQVLLDAKSAGVDAGIISVASRLLKVLRKQHSLVTAMDKRDVPALGVAVSQAKELAEGQSLDLPQPAGVELQSTLQRAELLYQELRTAADALAIALESCDPGTIDSALLAVRNAGISGSMPKQGQAARDFWKRVNSLNGIDLSCFDQVASVIEEAHAICAEKAMPLHASSLLMRLEHALHRVSASVLNPPEMVAIESRGHVLKAARSSAFRVLKHRLQIGTMEELPMIIQLDRDVKALGPLLNYFSTGESQLHPDTNAAIVAAEARYWGLGSEARLFKMQSCPDADLTRGQVVQLLMTTESGSGLRLRGVNLRGVDLSELDLSGAYLTRAKLDDADLSGSTLTNATIEFASVARAKFGGCDLGCSKIASCGQIDLSQCALNGANLSDLDLRGCDFQGQNLGHATFTSCKLVCRFGDHKGKPTLSKCDLNGPELQAAGVRSLSNITIANDCKLTGPFDGFNFKGTTFQCDLSGRSFAGANFEGAEFATSCSLDATVLAVRACHANLALCWRALRVTSVVWDV